MDDNLLIVCRSCGRKILAHNMRPDTSGENMICMDCFRKKAPVRSIIEEAKSAAPTRKAVEKTEPMNKYICTACKYKFSRKASREVEKCPYCGKHTIVVDNQLGADKLIKDSMNKRFETW